MATNQVENFIADEQMDSLVSAGQVEVPEFIPEEREQEFFGEEAPVQPEKQPGFLERIRSITRPQKEISTGILRGAGHTLFGVAKVGEKIADVTGINALLEKVLGPGAAGRIGEEPEFLKPKTTLEKVGFGIEQVAEFLLPVGGQAKALSLAQKLPKGIKIGTKAAEIIARGAGEAVEVGAKTLAQTGGDIKKAAISGAVGFGIPVVTSALGGFLKAAGTKIQTSVIKPSIKDVKDGFKIVNVQKYDVGGSLQESLVKTSSAIKQRVAKLNRILAGSKETVSLGEAYNTTVLNLAKNKTATFGNNLAIRRILKGLKAEISTIGTKVSVPQAQLTKQAAGLNGSWVNGMPDRDARAIEIVYNEFYSVLKKAVETKSGLSSAVRAVNKEISELIPINNAIVRRIPVAQRNNAIGLDDAMVLISTLFNPKTAVLVGITKGAKTGKVGEALFKGGKALERFRAGGLP